VQEFPTHVEEICSLIHTDDYDLAMDAMRDHLEGRKPLYDVAYRIRRKDGDYSWYYDRGGVTEWDTNGAPRRVVGTVIDITRLKTLEIELRAARDKAGDRSISPQERAH
jgi:two-component system CheB/CheR fusion protein